MKRAASIAWAQALDCRSGITRSSDAVSGWDTYCQDKLVPVRGLLPMEREESGKRLMCDAEQANL